MSLIYCCKYNFERKEIRTSSFLRNPKIITLNATFTLHGVCQTARKHTAKDALNDIGGFTPQRDDKIDMRRCK